ncbi:zinc-binding protein A33-like [Periophthalmus magnuspinnatus]|uniref:zinc-binding protein A33-like n=1 Tax=Periophthalmus magnuspinnatus TaxID=409849 RepID=UPI00145A7778|nr:zinc-binding protein A33-like [Periophthalmus magnuspinnatus]
MAEAEVTHFLTCSICLDTFTEPVSLGCHHSFCRTCLQKTWAQEKEKKCPVCRRKSSKSDPGVNFALKELSNSLRQKQESQEEPKAQTQKLREQQEQQEQQWSVCPLHPLVPSLFCLDEDRGVCAVCEFSEHKEHRVVKGEEAEKRLKEQIQSKIQTLKDQKKSCRQLEKTCEEIQQHSEEQALHCECQITAVFERMRRHLQEEQDRAVSALREEQRRQAQTINPQLHKLRETLSSLNSNIQELEKQLKTHTHRPLSSSPEPLPQLPKGLLLNQAKVLGNLGYRVWTSLRRVVQFSPVILDPNTAGIWLYLSEDLSGATCGDTYQQLPDNPERFTKYASVLGSEGFSSGTHQWDVEVGDHPDWNIGVAKESIDRKGEIFVSPEYGIWCLLNRDGKYTNSCGKPVKVQKPPEKIRVKLDCDAGRVSFYDTDHMTRLYTYTGSFTEKMFPYFSIGKSKESKTKEVRVCPTSGPQ